MTITTITQRPTKDLGEDCSVENLSVRSNLLASNMRVLSSFSVVGDIDCTSLIAQALYSTGLTRLAGPVTNQGAAFEQGAITGAITGSVNDWAPTGLSAARVIYVVPDAAGYSITGIDSLGLGASEGKLLTLINTSGNDVVLPHASGFSSGINQFRNYGAASFTLSGFWGAVTYWYASAVGAWVMVSTNKV